PAVADPRGRQLPWASFSAADLATRLADSRPDVRERAQALLGELGDAAVPALQATLRPGSAAATRQAAVWTLARTDGPAARAATRSALADADPSVVHAALQVTSLWRDAAALDLLLPRLQDSNLMLARIAAEALGRIGNPRAIPALLEAVGRIGNPPRSATGTPESPSSRAWEHALIHALIEINHPEPLRARLAGAASPALARVVLVALDQMSAGNLQAAEVLPGLGSSDPVRARTAAWIVSHRSDWGADLAGHFRSELRRPATAPEASAALAKQLADLAKSPAIQELLASTVTAASADARLIALRAMAGAGLKETPAAWLSALAAALDPSGGAVAEQAVATARTVAQPKGGDPALLAALARIGRQTGLKPGLRLDALALAASALRPVDPGLFDFLLAHLAPQQPLPLRTAAATTLSRAPLTPAQQLTLADAMRAVGALEAPRLLPAFERQPTEELGQRLLAALEKSPALAGLNAGLLRPLFAKYPAALQPAAGRLITAVNADAARQNARVDAVLAGVAAGDVRRGQAVFNSDKTACTLCHKIGYRGGLLGPDLTAIGRIRSERELLEAVMYPSATLVRGYEPVSVSLKSGESHGGILKKDAPDEIVLATGPETEVHLARTDVVDLQPGAISPMPPGMDVVLSPQELADLVAFLKSRS
ncbi:MAG: HEAT repeat domain-containing protein, partial [Verrucomicrobia bacterium]|nr:HEAT repeat domain-containing protein [Verrucomicrobiota bacterium]